ncbi:c-type cytochrome [Rhodoferax sp.]|uniref:c-type cytochrome n=1 Tax=Rhodoferax sp. TaxID=50421 RepID=UPI002ACE2A30|nr:c-type cytochrome [Rhodoferax sp.]MDZ7811856.1 c-type cytochrome [Ideonella sp.]
MWLLTLNACSPQPGPDALPRVVLDARLQGLYERACVHCHAAKGSGAPQQGDAAEWARRASQGDAALLASVRQGKGAMPPMAWCAECNQEDFQQLIAYLRAPKE